MRLKLLPVTNAAVQKIRQRILIVQSQQNCHADSHRKNLEFVVGDQVFLIVVSTYRGCSPNL